jgi:hypothetical protein
MRYRGLPSSTAHHAPGFCLRPLDSAGAVRALARNWRTARTRFGHTSRVVPNARCAGHPLGVGVDADSRVPVSPPLQAIGDHVVVEAEVEEDDGLEEGL